MSLIKPVPGGFDLVKKLLSESHTKFSILYKVFLANHLPHALYTHCSLGASLQRIQEYYDAYILKLEPLRDPGFEINLSNAWNYMGNKDAYPEYMQFFDKEIQSRKIKGCMSIFFPKLIGLSLGEALHPLIHIGYGLEFDNPEVLSEGFSYACTYPLEASSILIEVEPRPDPTEWCSVNQLLETVRAMEVPTLNPAMKNFHDKTEFVITEWVELRDILESWDHSWPGPDGDDKLFSKKLDELTEAAILLTFCTHADKIDFFLVHILTANHAVRSILPHLEKSSWKRSILLANLLGLLTTYVIQGRPEVKLNFVAEYTPKNADLTWEEIVADAVSREEEHVSKVMRTLVVYMESVPEAERGPIFTDVFIKKCALKAVDAVQDINSYLF